MANFLRTRALWADDTDLLYTEMEDMDIKTSLAINSEGGVYALIDDLIIGGAGELVIDANASFNGYTQFNGSVAFIDDVTFAATAPALLLGGAQISGLIVGGNTSLGNTSADAITIDGLLFVNEQSSFAERAFFLDGLQADGDSFFNDYAEFNAYTQFNNSVGFIDDVTFADLLICTGDAQFGDVLVGGTLTIDKPVVFTGTGKIKHRQALGGDGAATYQAAQVDTVWVPLGTLTADQNYTIGDTDAEDGMRIRFYNSDHATFAVKVKLPGGSPLDIIGGISSTIWGEYERIAGVWHRVAVGPAEDT